jgi:hypothetical protein
VFKWTCLGVAAAFLGFIGWVAYDIRTQLRDSAETVRTAGRTVNDHLPAVVEKTQATTETLADLAADVRQLKELAGATGGVRDQNLVAYAEGALRQVEASGGTVGLKKVLGGSGLKSELPAQEWAAGARKEAVFLVAVARSRKELATRLATNKFGSPWYIRVGDQEPVPLLDWLREHHPPSRDL